MSYFRLNYWSVLMSTTRLTFGAVLDTVNTTATVISSTLNAVGGASNMLGSFVTKAASEQRERHIADALTFRQRLMDEKAQERTLALIKTSEFCAKSKQHAEFYETAYNEFHALLNPKAE